LRNPLLDLGLRSTAQAHFTEVAMTAKPHKILADAISRVDTFTPVTGFDCEELSSLILAELEKQGLVIAPRILTTEMFAAGLAAHKPSLPACIMSVYNAELAAWSSEAA